MTLNHSRRGVRIEMQVECVLKLFYGKKNGTLFRFSFFSKNHII